MELTARHYAILNEIGIQVWELRSNEAPDMQASEQGLETVEQESVDLSADVLLLLSDEQLNPSAMNLLAAMLHSIALDFTSIRMINPRQLPQLLDVVDTKLLIVMGDDSTAQLNSFLGSSISEANQIQQGYFESISLIKTPSLTELLAYPAKKHVAWQTLLIIKKHLEDKESHA